VQIEACIGCSIEQLFAGGSAPQNKDPATMPALIESASKWGPK